MLIEDPQTLSDQDLHRLGDMVYRHCGINLHSGKKGLVAARMAKRLRSTGIPSVTDYMRHIMSDPDGQEFTHLIDALSTNLTSFFREPGHFEFLADRFLPDLLRRKGHSRRIRAWSAGCSSGQEPYSLAITLLDHLPAGAQWDIKILATDISTRMLQLARRGVYPREQAEAVPALTRQKHLIPGGSHGQEECHVSPALRKLVRFRYLNLMEPWPFNGTFDFIFCRNVMIYFDKPTQQKLIGRFWESLASGGLLFTGHSESLTGVSHQFRYLEPTIYAKP